MLFRSAPVSADVKNVSPALFFSSSEPVSSQLAAFHANSGVLVDQAHPAAAGETVEMYGTGLGTTIPAVPAGSPAPFSPPARTLLVPQAQIGIMPAEVTFSGLTPGFAGVYQVNVVIPRGLRSGFQSVQWKFGDGTVAASGTIAVQ